MSDEMPSNYDDHGADDEAERHKIRQGVARELMASILKFADDDYLFIEDIEDAFDAVLDWRDKP